MTRCKFLLLLLCCTLFGNVFAQDCPRIYRSGDTLKTDPAGGYQWFFNGNPIPSATSQWFLAKDKGNYTVEVSGTSYPFPVIFGKNELIGRVFDHKYEPVAGAKITLIDQTTVTDAQGNFRFASVSNLLPTAVLTATKESYWKNVQRVTFFKNSPTFVNLMLDTLLVTSRIDAKTGAYISNRGFTLQIPPNGVVTADGQTYQGMINLSLKRGFPSEENFGYRMPGGDFSAIDANGQEKILISYGFMSAEMHGDNGEELKLAPEAEATLEFYTSFAGNKVNPDSMPLWHFDERHALWFPEGTARKVGPRYVGTVKHFSSWNCDLPEERATVTGTVVNCKGNPIPGIPVTVGQRKVTCNAGGTYETFVPASTAIEVTVNYIDSLHVAPLNNEEIRNVNQLNGGSTIWGAVGLVDKEGVFKVYGNKVMEYSIDNGKTYHSKNDTLQVGYVNQLKEGKVKDEDGCESSLKIIFLQRQEDCQVIDRWSQETRYGSIAEAVLDNRCVRLMSLNNTTLSIEEIKLMSDIFPCMQSIYLEKVKITTLPESIGNWVNLQHIAMANNQLAVLPEGVGNWVNITDVIFFNNNLSSLPEGVGNWVKISSIVLQFNKLSSLPEGVGNWKELQSLSLSSNLLTSLPEGFWNCTKLRWLDLERNLLTDLSEKVGNLKDLQTVELSFNQLTTLPESIGNLSNLEKLNLTTNHLTTLPESIGQLTSLVKLSIDGNQLTTLPASIANLKDSLKELFLYGNPFSEEEIAKIRAWLPNTTIYW